MHIAEVVTIAKSLPLLRLNTYKSLILSYSADYRRIFRKNSTLVMILKILGVGYVSSVKVMMVLFGLVLKIRDYFIFIRKVERLKNSHILLFIKMFMVYVWTVMICG
jgi:hypothetical protein